MSNEILNWLIAWKHYRAVTFISYSVHYYQPLHSHIRRTFILYVLVLHS